jgi:hypothetical protein
MCVSDVVCSRVEWVIRINDENIIETPFEIRHSPDAIDYSLVTTFVISVIIHHVVSPNTDIDVEHCVDWMTLM